MTKFAVVGDVHGNINFANSMCHKAMNAGIDTIYQVGDFGLWDHYDDGIKFLNNLNRKAVECGVMWYWVPGNHENYDSLAVHRAQDGGLDERGFVVIRSNIRSTDKVLTWDHDGLAFGAVGGAVSIDRHYRVLGKSWWPQETTTMDDVTEFQRQMLKYSNTLDVLLTHDSPTTLPSWDGFIKDDALSERNRQAMDMVYTAANAQIAFHGHYHRHLAYKFNETAVIGLSCDPDGAGHWGGDLRNYAIVEVSPSLYGHDYEVDVFARGDQPERQYSI